MNSLRKKDGGTRRAIWNWPFHNHMLEVFVSEPVMATVQLRRMALHWVMIIESSHMSTPRKIEMPNGFYAISLYLFLLPLALFSAALAWTHWATDSLYRCTDPTFGILDIIPPFVHIGTDDVYLVPAWRVWLTWACVITAALSVPWLITWSLWRSDRNDEP